MDVRCPKCGTGYALDGRRIGPGEHTVRCSACRHVFRLRLDGNGPPDAPSEKAKSPPPPPGRSEWLVRTVAGRQVAFRELTTLQKWIVEGRIGRDDEISRSGDTWKRLGNIAELEPFFSVYEKAKSLEELIEGASGLLPAWRGSEIVAAARLEGVLSLAPAPSRLPAPGPFAGVALPAEPHPGSPPRPPPEPRPEAHAASTEAREETTKIRRPSRLGQTGDPAVFDPPAAPAPAAFPSSLPSSAAFTGDLTFSNIGVRPAERPRRGVPLLVGGLLIGIVTGLSIRAAEPWLSSALAEPEPRLEAAAPFEADPEAGSADRAEIPRSAEQEAEPEARPAVDPEPRRGGEEVGPPKSDPGAEPSAERPGIGQEAEPRGKADTESSRAKRSLAKPPDRPDETFGSWMKKAHRERQRGRPKNALDAYGRAADLNPRAAEPHAGKGWCYLDLGNARLALLAFTRAARLDDTLAEAHLGTAEAQVRSGERPAAIAAYRRYLDRAPPAARDRIVAERKLAELEAASTEDPS